MMKHSLVSIPLQPVRVHHPPQLIVEVDCHLRAQSAGISCFQGIFLNPCTQRFHHSRGSLIREIISSIVYALTQSCTAHTVVYVTLTYPRTLLPKIRQSLLPLCCTLLCWWYVCKLQVFAECISIVLVIYFSRPSVKLARAVHCTLL